MLRLYENNFQRSALKFLLAAKTSQIIMYIAILYQNERLRAILLHHGHESQCWFDNGRNFNLALYFWVLLWSSPSIYSLCEM